MPFGKKQASSLAPDDLFHASFDRKPLLFVHIPKTAGTSFKSVLMSKIKLSTCGASFVWIEPARIAVGSATNDLNDGTRRCHGR